MVYAGIISHLIEFLLCVLYGVVVLTVIPECREAIVFHLRIVTDAYVSAREQIRSLKLVVVYAFLIIIIVGITIIRCGVHIEPYLLCQRETALCRKCRRKECEKEIRKGLSHSEQNWLHGFCRGLFSPSKLKLCGNNRKVMEKKPENIKQSSKSAKPPSEERKTQSKPKIGKIVRVVPMGVPFSPERFKWIQELSRRDLSN